ncbi:hypothetical protein GCM10027442_13500 [Emticicia fontis]
MLVADLLGNAYGVNRPLINMNGILYFQADDGIHGIELWKSDGTAGGTTILKDMNPAGNGNPQDMVKIASTIYMSGFDYSHGYELWKTDGTTAGTVLLKDIVPDYTSSAPRNLKNFNNTLYFSVKSNNELWKSNGTEAGTVVIKVMPANTYISNIIPSGSNLFFTLGLQNGSEQLWKTDGTEVGTVMLKGFSQASYGHIALNNGIYFSGNDGVSGFELWKSDGTTAGTIMVKELVSGAFGGFPTYLTIFNNLIYFSSNGNLYRSDGTDAGTVAVSGLDGYYLTNVNGNLYFANSNNGYEIYKYNGSTFTLLKYFERYDNMSEGIAFFGLPDGSVFFTSKESNYGQELWKTNGTSAGTTLVADLMPGIQGSSPANFASVGTNILYFTANDGTSGFELWRRDGSGNVNQVKNIEPDHFSSNPNNLASLNNLLFFNATDQYSTHLFIANSDNPSNYPQNVGILNPSNFQVFNNKMYFQAEQYNGKELFVSDGSTTTQVKNIYTGASGTGENSSSPTELTPMGSFFYFAATSTGDDREFWKSDGTEAGTTLVKNINTIGSSSPNHLIEFEGNLYFFATSSSTTQLYKSNGTSAGTDVLPPNNYNVNVISGEIAETSSKLYLQASTSTTGTELFYLNGSTVTLLKDIRSGSIGSAPSNFTAIKDRLYFTANDGTSGIELWKSDGTGATTTLVKDIRPGTTNSNISNLIRFNNILIFSANDGVHGQELWKSDGTPGGTVMVKDIIEGSDNSNPANFCLIGNTLYFSAYHPKFGIELWKTDGTEEGTVLVYDLNWDNEIYSGNSVPSQLTNVNGILYFVADNGLNGNELFYFKPCPESVQFYEYTYTPSYTYHANQTIHAYHKIDNGLSINYFAGQSVLLSPGFNVDAHNGISARTNVFRAEARGCN